MSRSRREKPLFSARFSWSRFSKVTSPESRFWGVRIISVGISILENVNEASFHHSVSFIRACVLGRNLCWRYHTCEVCTVPPSYLRFQIHWSRKLISQKHNAITSSWRVKVCILFGDCQCYRCHQILVWIAAFGNYFKWTPFLRPMLGIDAARACLRHIKVWKWWRDKFITSRILAWWAIMGAECVHSH